MTGAAAGLAGLLSAGRRPVITSELVPPRSADAGAVRRAVSELAFADALNVTDLPGARPRMSALAAAAIAAGAGAEPILQMTCRDRNRLALAADALGAMALGIRAVLPLTGDPVPDGVPGVAVGDIDAAGLVRLLADLASGTLPDGAAADPAPPPFVIGATASPGRTRPELLLAKVDSGAAFVQTQIVLDPDRFEEWLASIRPTGALDRAALLPSVVVPSSARSVELVQRFGAQVADGVAARADAGEGEAVAREVVGRLLRIPEVRGLHVLAIGSDTGSAARLASFARDVAAEPDPGCEES
jgi:methylenetetrahydrofolate reductase (NADH)